MLEIIYCLNDCFPAMADGQMEAPRHFPGNYWCSTSSTFMGGRSTSKLEQRGSKIASIIVCNTFHIDEDSVQIDYTPDAGLLDMQSAANNPTAHEDVVYAASVSSSNGASRKKNRVVPRDYLPQDSCITDTHVASAYPDEYHKASEDQRNSWLNAMIQERASCRSWAKIKIEDIFISEAHVQGLPVDSLGDLKRVWRKDGSDATAEKMFQVLYGVFDRDPAWSKRLETEYMEDFASVEYSKEGSTVGCFEALITHKKSALVVSVNNATKKSHGRRINISRPKSMINDDNKFDKREKGTFMNRFATTAKGSSSSTNSEECLKPSKKMEVRGRSDGWIKIEHA